VHLVEVGFNLEIDSGDGLGLRGHAAFEPEVLAALRRFIRPGMKVIDAGAHIGYFTLHISQLVGQHGHVYGFEPEQGNLKLLQKNIASNKRTNVTVHPFALGECDGAGMLHLSEYNSGIHRLYSSLCCGSQAMQVPVRSLDAIFPHGKIDLIKIDIEGFEPFALAGARLLIQRQGPVILSEYCPPAMLEAGASITRHLAFLKQEGYLVNDAEGLTVPWGEMQADALRWERFGHARLQEACAMKTNPEIAATCEQIARDLGCTRRFIENIVFIPIVPKT